MRALPPRPLDELPADHCMSLGPQSQMTHNIVSGWWFQTWLLFSIIHGIILPIDFHMFQRGGSTTNQIMILKHIETIWNDCKPYWINHEKTPLNFHHYNIFQQNHWKPIKNLRTGWGVFRWSFFSSRLGMTKMGLNHQAAVDCLASWCFMLDVSGHLGNFGNIFSHQNCYSLPILERPIKVPHPSVSLQNVPQLVTTSMVISWRASSPLKF
jgi:hypothetical protein